MIDILVLLLKPALLWESDKLKYWYFLPLALIAWLADMFIAHTTWAIIYGWPHKGEWTISHTLERLANPAINKEHPDFKFLVEIGHMINRRSPSKNHIKIVNT